MSNTQSEPIAAEVEEEEEICDNDVKRMAKRAGVKMLSSAIPQAMWLQINESIDQMMRVTSATVEASGRKTVSKQDAMMASKHLGLTVMD